MIFRRILLLSAFVIAAIAISLPPELSVFTGLGKDQLESLILSDVSRILDTRSTCPINDTSRGVFPGPANPTLLGIAKRNAFVYRVDSKLYLLGELFRMVGANSYWLGLDENVVPDPSYPSKTRILEAFADFSVMGATTVRAQTLGMSVGNPLSAEPALDVFNEAAYEAIDFAILVARVYGIKLIIPLVDNYNYYEGGKYTFIGWHNISFNGSGAAITPPDVGAFFYNTTAIVDSYKRYITHHLNHVNQYTGIAYKDDPTILAWETGNELAAVRFADGPAPPTWTREIAQLIKSLAPRHLVMDGTYGLYPGGQLEVSEIDIFSDHFYPANISKALLDIAEVKKVKRSIHFGEFDWTGQYGGDDVKEFLGNITQHPEAGDTFWSLFGHDDECCQYVEHDDGYSFYYLRENETNSLYTTQGKILIEHASEMTGVPALNEPAVACPQYRFPKDLLPLGVQL